MQSSPAILTILAVLVCFAVASSQLTAAEIMYWPVASPQPSTLARVSYNLTSLKSDVLSYSPPAVANGNPPSAEDPFGDLIRVGLYTSTPSDPKHWVGTLTSLSSLTGGGNQKPAIQLHLSPSNEVYHVSLRLSSFSSSNTTTMETNPDIELVPTEAGPRPHLNRPIVVNPDGQGPQEPVEKTFLQK